MQALQALQDIDRHIYRVRAELERLPRERRRREDQLAAQRAQVEAEQTRVRTWQARVKEIEDLTLTQRQRIRKLETEANSSRDVAVVEACRYEIRTLKRQIDDAEREAIENVEQIEAAQARIGQLNAALQGELEVFSEFSSNVEGELADAEGRLSDLEARRKERMSNELDPQSLAIYERLLDARGGEAMARLEGGVCQACYMEVPPNLQVRLTRATELIQCPSCDRILFLG